METIVSHVYESLRSYWRRRSYKRLDGSSASRKKVVAIRLGGGRNTKSRRSWKLRAVRLILRPRVKLPSPVKLLARLRNAYVDAMLMLAKGGAMPSLVAKKCGTQELVWSRRIPRARQNDSGSKDFERRMMIHIYNSIINAPREITAY